MVTRLLHCCGLELGRESELMPRQADNPEGFWEHLGFVTLNDELLNELGGAWDLPPKLEEKFTDTRLDPLRAKARLLIESFDSARVWGWKDPRNSLTLPFWQNLLRGLKTVILVRNPLEVAHSMRRRNGTSYSFGLRLWEIYNRRLIETVKDEQRLVTHYDLFFEDPESELLRITHFAGLPDANVKSAAALINRRKRRTRFTLDELIVAQVSAEVIDLYRALIAEANQGSKALTRKDKRKTTEAGQTVQTRDPDLLRGSVSRLKAFIPEQSAEIQELRERLEETEARHKTEIEKICERLEETEARHKTEIEKICERLEETEARHKTEIEKIRDGYEAELKRLTAEQAQMREVYEAELKRQKAGMLCAVRTLSRLLEDVEKAANRLRSSRRWGLANPVTAIKAKLFPGSVTIGYGYLEKIVAAYTKWKDAHPEIAKIDEQINALRRAVATAETERGLEPSAQKCPKPCAATLWDGEYDDVPA
jgi:hypothetical protein